MIVAYVYRAAGSYLDPLIPGAHVPLTPPPAAPAPAAPVPAAPAAPTG